MGAYPSKYGPIFILLALCGLLCLLRYMFTLESWRCQAVSFLYQQQSSMGSTFSHADGSPPQEQNRSDCANVGQQPSTEEAWEQQYLLSSISWPGPVGPPPPLRQSTDPVQSFFLISGQTERRLGEQLEVTVHMHNYLGQAKPHGGDFLLARLHSPELGAGVTGKVRDLGNGNYTVVFPLLWVGVAQVEVVLVHPSEAVTALRRLREERPNRVFFKSLFRSGVIAETTECNMCLPAGPRALCDYTDPHTGEPWFCYKPRLLACDTRVNHAVGGYRKNLLTSREALFFQSDVNIKVPVRAAGQENVTVVAPRTAAVPGAVQPSGYYYAWQWQQMGGPPMRRFNDTASVTQCLKGKIIHMFGDSTVRQWFEYLNTFIPGINLYSPKRIGPYMAVDRPNNILIQYRCHGPPIRFTGVLVSELHYISSELDRLTGGPDTVVALSIWSHFSTFPVEVYIRRLRHIRRAVARLLDRAPSTLVLIRTANPQKLDPEGSMYNSDWFSAQLDTVLRTMFKRLNVHLVDAWDMTLAHGHPHLLHPPPAIVKNAMDLVLSHICPMKKKKKRS